MSTISDPNAAITREDIEELRWLGREVLADQVDAMLSEGGINPGGSFGDLERLIAYARALGALGTDLSLRFIGSGRWDAPAYSDLAPLLEAADWLEKMYRDFDAAAPADRVVAARSVLDRLRRLSEAA